MSHPQTQVNRHVKESLGGDSEIFKHYSTTNETTYGKHWATHFNPRKGTHSGAGYVPNIRPQIVYRKFLDKVDNLSIGKLLLNNNHTTTELHFQPYGRTNGSVTLPAQLDMRPSGFTRDKALSLPKKTQIENQFIDSKTKAMTTILPSKHQPLLHRINNKDKIQEENCGYGPKANHTEYKANYLGSPMASYDLARTNLGAKEQTGFQENYRTDEPVQGRPHESFCSCGENSLCQCKPLFSSRPTGITNYSVDYVPLQCPTGRESWHYIPRAATISNGFTKGNNNLPAFIETNSSRVFENSKKLPEMKLEKLKKSNPAEYQSVIHPEKDLSISHGIHSDMSNLPQDMIAMQNRKFAGPQELTGHSSNPIQYTQTRDDPARFITHHSTKFYNPTCVGTERNGHVDFNIKEKYYNKGFSSSFKLNSMESQADWFKEMRKLQPYQARSIMARDVVVNHPTKLLA